MLRSWFLALLMVLITLPLYSANATTRYVAKAGDGGSDSNSCATSATLGTPKLTITSALTCINAGDTLLIRTGTYVELMDLQTKPVTGTVNSRVWIGAYNGETVTIAPGGATAHVVVFGGATDYVTFDGLILDGTSSWNTDNAAVFRAFGTSSNGITLQNSEIKNGSYSGVFMQSGSGLQLLNNNIHHNGAGAGLPGGLGVYAGGATSALIKGNTVHHNNCGGIRSFDTAVSPQATDNIIERNHVYSNGAPSGVGTCVNSDEAGIFIGDQRNVARYNVVYGNGEHGIYVYKGGGTCANNLVYNNTSYNNTYGVRIRISCSSTIVRNNLSLGNSASNYTDAGTSTTQSNNKTNGTITDCTVSTSDFTQKATSTCIDAGSSLTTYAYNGSAPDIGAFETLVFASCVIENGDASKIRVTFTNNLFPPLIAPDAVGWSSRQATVSNAITAAVITGTNREDLTTTAPITNGTAVDITAVATNLTDSALIGNSLKQPYVQTLSQQSCTNNVGGAPSYVFTQQSFKFFGLRGTESAPIATPYASAPENTNILVMPGGKVRLRLALKCTTSDCPATGFFPFYSCAACTSAGTYTQVPDTYAAGEQIGFCGTSADPDIPTSGTPTATELLTAAGTFDATGAIIRSSNAIPTVTLSAAHKTELEYCVGVSSSASANNAYIFELRKQDGSQINAYTVRPTITVTPASAGMGF